jgi:hypothetical protein
MILDGIGTFQTAKDVFQHRGRAIRILGNILTSRWLSPTLCIFSIAALYLIEFGIPSAIWDRDLRVSIPRYTFNQDSGKLVSEVYFVNHGNARRTVMAVHFAVRSKSAVGDERQLLVDNPREVYAGGKSFYIAPNEPITQSFEQTIDPTLLRVDGNIFGFHFYTLDGDGRPNYTNVDVLEITDAKALGMAQLAKRVEHVSLDKRWDKKAGYKWKKTALAALVAIILGAVVWTLLRQRPTAGDPPGSAVGLSGKLEAELMPGEQRDAGRSWAAIQKQSIEMARDSARAAEVRAENERRDRARAVSDLVDRAEERITKDKISYPLFALQRAEAATLKTEQEFLDACEALHHRRFAHPLKSFKDMEIDWLKFVRFANKEETDLLNDAEVYKCLVKFRSTTDNQQVAASTDKTELEQHQDWERDQAENGISIVLPRSFTPPTAAQRQQLANFEQKLVNLREKGGQLLTTPESPGFDIPGVILRNLKSIDEIQGEIDRLENEQRNPNASARSLRPIERRDLIDGVIADGKLLMRLWKMRLEPMAASQRYSQSMKWLSNGNATAKKHLTIQQFDQVSGKHHNADAMDMGDRAMFALAIIEAGIKSDSADYELAIQVASRLEVLRNLRRVFTQLS